MFFDVVFILVLFFSLAFLIGFTIDLLSREKRVNLIKKREELLKAKVENIRVREES